MARAAIPWNKIEKSARKVFPKPIYEDIFVFRPNRNNDLKAPTTVYDRTTGNYAVIGYNVMVHRDMLTGFDKDLRPKWKSIRNVVFIPV